MFWGPVDTTPHMVFNTIRRSRRVLVKKRKESKRNSLLIFNTSNPGYHFFHKVDEFIFIEMPQVKKAFFLFYQKKFSTHKIAYDECMAIIKEVYKN
jgi:hypothetical protein